MSFFILSHLVASSNENRNKVVEEITKMADYTRDHEKETLKYAVTIPLDQQDNRDIYIIEEFSNEDALRTHQSSSIYRSLLDLLSSSEPPLLKDTPALILANPFNSMTRDYISKNETPFILLGTVDYVDGGLDKSLPYWKDIFETTDQSEEGTLSYSLCKDREQPDKLRTIEVYKDSEYLWTTHAKSRAVAENVKNTKHLRTGLKHIFLRIVGGYFLK